jgi:signal peptidase I
MLAAWGASVGDLFVLRGDRDAVPIWQMALFFLAGLVAPVATTLVLRAIVLESLLVPTASMEPAVLAGDHLFADRRAFSHGGSARYGDVIVFASPEHPDQLLVKRVVARPGDSLEVKRGHPFVNGWAVPSCSLGSVTLDNKAGELEVEFLGDASYLVFYDTTPAPTHAGPLWAANDAVLVLGDNRNDSADSRAWFGGRDGNVHASAVRGRALFVWFRASEDDDARFGVDLAHPALPAVARALRPQLDACLAARPVATPPSR